MARLADASPRAREDEATSLRAQLERLQSELAAERARRRECEQQAHGKDDFLAVVAHELRAPLGAILGWAHLLRRRGSEEEFQRGLDVIEQSVAVQGKLIDDLLVMSRMASDRVRLDLALLHPRVFIDAALQCVRPLALEKGVELHLQLDDAAGPVRGDAMRLQQVATNLLANALKFTPERGRIDVSLSRSGGWALFAVSDTGIGIAPDFLPHVFDRFRQDPQAARSRGGLGLGLAIARHLVELHGGEIEARSEGEGRGSTFLVRLPLAEPDRQSS